jgi:DNA-binding NarL/FixJ family response regulator
MKVFITEDNLLIREWLATMVSVMDGVQVVGQAETIAAAAEGICHTLPDVVILDFHLPDGLGLDLLPMIKRQEPAPVAIVYTASTTTATRLKCLGAGADYVYDKGLGAIALLETMDRLVHLHTGPGNGHRQPDRM